MTDLRNTIRNISIDDYCMRYSSTLLKKYEPLLKMDLTENNSNYYVTTYEQMVTNFNEWSYKIFDMVEVPKDKQESIYNKYKKEFEIVMEEATPEMIFSGESKRHKRKMLPGDHKEKLKNLTIANLTNKFHDVLKLHEKFS